MVDLARLDAALDHIEKHPEDHVQETWRCESGLCFAGHIAVLAGGEWAFDADSVNAAEMLAIDSDEMPFETMDGRAVVHVSDRAKALLGLSDNRWAVTAEALFAAHNNVASIRHIRNQIEAGYRAQGLAENPVWVMDEA